MARVKRLKSRHRQKAQNAQAGIKLVTDMSAFRRQNQPPHGNATPIARAGKFVDAAALRALEGEPNSASVGNWNWFKKSKTQSPATASSPPSARTPDHQLSPEDRPIVIGIAFNSEELGGPSQAATYADAPTPVDAQPQTQVLPGHPARAPDASSTPVQQRSVWSPDTPDTASSFGTVRYTSNIYSHYPSPGAVSPGNVPPVPVVPANFKQTPRQKLISLQLGATPTEESDAGTPCTLFEEDGAPSPLKQARGKASALTPDSPASKTNGWWDHHVVTPFMEKRLTFNSTRKQKLESPKDGQNNDEWWWNKPELKPGQGQHLTPKMASGPFDTPIVRAPTPRRVPSPRAETGPTSTHNTAATSLSPESSPMTEKPRIVVTEEASPEQPPPYSPPEKKADAQPVRYRAVFPPGHPLQAQFPPSPGPVSPGLSSTMSSQGATQMTEIPLASAPRDNTRLSQMALPVRSLGTYLPQEHSHEEAGQMTKSERNRRRHEKEDLVAQRIGGFWRGRGCIPSSGCFGRTGREGRQRRRLWMAVLGTVLVLLILSITLGVVLSRPKDGNEIPSMWVNLTDFPPMPTGALTVVGTDNVVSKSGCTEPSTLWSCSLPKEQHESVEPYKPSQPTFLLDIQWDNSTQESWKVPNGDAPTPKSRRSVGRAAHAGSMVRERDSGSDFKSSPSPPGYQEMWFLGNTTDQIQSDEKGGEATPFYISLVDSTKDKDLKELNKRQTSSDGNVSLTEVLPSPDLDEDGKAKPAVMVPKPVQQPVRLYDRGLPTEHYSFYTYFKRTIYLKSVTVLNETKDKDIPLDQDGGCRETEADFLTTWSETRFLVQIWTRTLGANTSTLLQPKGMGSIDGTPELIRPGTMPYPVTVTIDTHGGEPSKKFVWMWPINDRQQLDEENPKLLANNIGFGGTWINKRSRGDKSFGGFDGGTGGCKCQWVNWV